MQKGFLGGRNSLISALGSSQIASQMHIVRSKAPTQETQGKFMKQILFWLSISNLKWCTSVLCTTFPFPHTLKFGHAANLIQSGRTILSCSTLECEVKSTDQTFLCFYCEWPVHSVQRPSFRLSIEADHPQKDVWKNTLWLSSQIKFVLSAAASAKSSHHSKCCRQGAGQCSSPG